MRNLIHHIEQYYSDYTVDNEDLEEYSYPKKRSARQQIEERMEKIKLDRMLEEYDFEDE